MCLLSLFDLFKEKRKDPAFPLGFCFVAVLKIAKEKSVWKSELL